MDPLDLEVNLRYPPIDKDLEDLVKRFSEDVLKSLSNPETGWRFPMMNAVTAFLSRPSMAQYNSHEHVSCTPARFVKMLEDVTKGYGYDPAIDLETLFTEEVYDEMLVLADIPFKSMCSHHLLPFYGKAHFGYIPDKKIVGLSKVPRVIDGFSTRLQVQERLTTQIVETFQKYVSPKGCGLVMSAVHMCVCMRGVEKDDIVTTTSHLSGCFKTNSLTKQEFLSHIYGRR